MLFEYIIYYIYHLNILYILYILSLKFLLCKDLLALTYYKRYAQVSH